ncbi:MAG: hypothetical protein CMM50_06110 [Rhodospirillaceae bacterium]|nr:hypothetical protein [Rhodospirillaceae bacterium]
MAHEKNIYEDIVHGSDARGPDSDETAARRQVHRDAEELDRMRFNYSLAEPGETSVGGGMLRHGGAGALTADAGTSEKEKRKKARREMDRLFWLQQQMAQLDFQIAENEGEIARLKSEVSGIEHLEEQLEAGTLDPNDPSTQAKLERLGIDPEKFLAADEEMRRKMLNQAKADREGRIGELERENERLRDRREELAAEKEELRHETSLSADEKITNEAEIEIEAIERVHEQLRIQDTGQTDDLELERESQTKDSVMTEEAQIEHFMREFARAQKLEDPMERLAREKELVEDLSDSARETIEWTADEQTARVFQKDYFGPLKESDASSGTRIAQEVAPTPIG